jgi:iron complex outermembrane recepter protein
MDSREDFGRCTCQVILVLILTFVSTVSAAEEVAETKVKFNIPAIEFPKSILEFSHQSKVEVLFLANDALRRVITRPIRGELPPREALARMLRGTGLIFEFDSGHSVTIRQPQSELQDLLIEFDIPAGPADQTFTEWSRQAGKQLLFDYDVVRQYRTEAIKGKFDPIDSLLRMTHGTDLVASQVNDRTYSLTRVVAHRFPGKRLTDSLQRLLSSQSPDVAEILIATARAQGLTPLPGEPVLTFNRTEIEATGISSVPEFLTTVPQVWGGGPNEYSQIGREGQTNTAHGSGLNFHGLGAESTLVLIDGVRPAKSGLEAGWWDDSLLPLGAIERIEIVPDGGSIRYGSDAISAVVNFVTRRDFSGAETQAQFSDTTSGGVGARRISQLLGHHWANGDASLILEYYDRDALSSASRAQATSDLRPWGGANWNSPYGYPGTLVTTGRTWAITGVSDGKPVLGPMGSSNTYDRWQAADVLPWEQRLSVMGHGSVLLGDVRIWSDLWWSDKHSTASEGYLSGQMISIPSTNPGYVNPLGTDNPVYVRYGFGNLLGPATYNASTLSASAATGVVVEKPGWSFDLSAQTGLERDRLLQGGIGNGSAFAQALSAPDPLNPFGPASSVDPAVLAGLSLTEFYQSYSRIQEVDAGAKRMLRAGSAGDAEFSIGAQYRQESLDGFNSLQGWQNDDRKVKSIYSSLDLPIVGKGQAVPLVTRLEVSIGGRYENYSDGGTATSPFFSLQWSPVSTVSLRGTYRRGFRPPALTERETVTNLSAIITVSDGRTALVETGGNPSLRPEIARTWTGGFDYKPSERMQLSATYYTVASSGRIFIPSFSSVLTQFNGRIIENPTASLRAAVCSESQFVTGPQAMCEQATVDLFMDARLLSIEKLTTSGMDVMAQYAADEWKLRFDGNYLLTYEGVWNGAILEQLNTLNNPVDLRFRAAAARNLGPLTITGSVSYTDRYWDTLSQPRRRVGSWTTVDLAARYKPADVALLRGADIILAVRNLMDRGPPFANNGQAPAGWDPANGGDLEGRVVSGEIRWTW